MEQLRMPPFFSYRSSKIAKGLLSKEPLPQEKTSALSQVQPKVPLIDIQSLVLTDIIGKWSWTWLVWDQI